ncbi:MAG: ankyrin repeat domain-containing protein [Saprospiraceae bacterium]
MLKIIYIFNWICIGLLVLFVLLMLLDPNKGGGDAATKGLGTAFIILGSVALAVLLLLNLLPWPWSKYLAFALVVLPILFYFGSSKWTAYKRALHARIEAAKPIFDDPDIDRLARLIEAGEAQALQKRLSSEPKEVVQSTDLLWFALQEASSSSYRAEEKLQCLRVLLDAGAPLDTLLKGDTPVQGSAANTGNAAVLRLLFERGADPNVRAPNADYPYIFDAIVSYRDPLAAVQTFIEFGADPNATAIFDDEDGPITPLIRAAQFDKWKICATLIEKGARPDFKTPNGKSCAFYMEEAKDAVLEYRGPETQADFAGLEALVGKGK